MTSSRPFYDFLKMKIQRDQTIFDSWHLPFLIAPNTTFQKMKHWNLDIIGYWKTGAGYLIEKELELSPSHSNYLKVYSKLLPLFISIIGQVWWLNELWLKKYIQKRTLSHILILIMTSQIWGNHGMVKNTKI